MDEVETESVDESGLPRPRDAGDADAAGMAGLVDNAVEDFAGKA